MAKKCEEHDRVRANCAICSPESVFRQYAYKAKARNLSFSITLAEFEALVNARCYWCGQYGANGIDRVDNRIGYISSNCVAACMECNFAKRVMLPERFLRMAERIAKYQQEKQKKAA